ncbi:hypothetical protein BJ912DRAFT_979793 [Pholiota molesta]|nr:hypothetical protein BJ912DRAFT_979793 [Pholiota molesta]
MARKKKASMNMEANRRSRTPSISEHTQKSHLSTAPKHRMPKADEIVRRKMIDKKANLRLNRFPEGTEHELQDDALSRQQQLLESSNNSPLAYHSPHDELATELERRAPNDKGKERAHPRMQENKSREFSMYESDYQEDSMSDQRRSIQPSTSSLVQYPPSTATRNQPSKGFFEGPINNVEIKGGTINHTLGHHTNLTIQVNRALCLLVCNKIYERHLGLKQRGFPLWIPEPNRSQPLPYRCKGVHVGDVGIITPSGAFSFLFNICLPRDDPINPRTLPDGFAPIYPPIESTDIRVYQEFNPESYLASKAIEKIRDDPQFP